MKLKFSKPDHFFTIIFGLFFFFTLLKFNQLFFEYGKLTHNVDSIEIYILNFINFSFEKIYYFDFIIFVLLVFPGYFLIKSEYNFTNLSNLAFYIFFFTPFFIFFHNYDLSFYDVISNKEISLSQKQINLLLFVLYLNLILLIFFSKIKFQFKLKKIYFSKKKIKLFLFLILIGFLVIFFKKIYYEDDKIIFNLQHFTKVETKSYRNYLTGYFGYGYYFILYIVLPTFFLIEKKYSNLLLVTFCYLLLYFFFKTKINLLFLSLILFQNQFPLFFKESQNFLFKFVIVFLFASLLGSIFFSFNYEITSLYFERIFLVIPKNLFLVFDYLNFNKPIYLSHISLFNSYYPLQTNFYDTIKIIYGGGSATSNSYIMEGLASFGLAGLFLVTFLIIFITRFIDCQIKIKDNDLFLIYFFQIFGFVSYPLSTQLSTYGLGATIVLSMIMIKK